MCLNPISIRNPTKRLSMSGGQPLTMRVRCGHCVECKDAIRKEWRFRTYHHVKDCIEKGGFVYFDTLTYSETCVPHLSDFVTLNGVADFYVFNHKHWRDFLKNLRRQLAYHYKGVRIEYIITSEYGTDERYTHRPHYHILIFVYFYFPDIQFDSYDLSALVSKCWKYGRTDGLPYQDRTYVLEHTFTKSCDCADYMKACNYVCKYITKDSTFQDEIRKRKELLKKHLSKDEYDVLIRSIDMFHRQSKGFGLSYLKTLTPDEYRYIYENNACRLDDAEQVVLVIPLPMYYARRMFYKCKQREDKTCYWELTITGRDYYIHKLLNIINKTEHDIRNRIANIHTEDLQYLNNLLGNRSWLDYSVYKTLYKFRMIPVNFHSNDDYNYNVYDWLGHIRSNLTVNSVDCNYLDVVEHDGYKNVHYPFMTDKLFTFRMYADFKRTTIDYDTYILTHTYNQNTLPHFYNFDKIDAILQYLQQPLNNIKQITADFISNLELKFKHLEKYGN